MSSFAGKSPIVGRAERTFAPELLRFWAPSSRTAAKRLRQDVQGKDKIHGALSACLRWVALLGDRPRRERILQGDGRAPGLVDMDMDVGPGLGTIRC
jgi:hypothetical protein